MVCKKCKELNEEKENISVTGIYISNADYYNYSMKIIYCPECGEILDKFKDKSKEELNYLREYSQWN